jgi:CBS domain-containing protein
MAAQTVQDIMTTNVVTVQVDTNLVDAARMMREKDIGDVVVIDKNRLVGVVTDRDVVVRAVAEGLAPDTTTVGSVVSRDLVTVRPEDSAVDVARLMRDRAVRRVPVVDDDGLVGIVSIGDLAVEIDPASVLGGISGAVPNN